MHLKDELIATLEALSPRVIDHGRAALECDKPALAISCLLAQPQGLALIEYIIEELEGGKKPLYAIDRFLERTRFAQLIERFRTTEEQESLNVLLRFYHQMWMNQRQGPEDPRALHEVLKRLAHSEAVASRMPALSICLDCGSGLNGAPGQCERCGKSDLLRFYELSLAQTAREALKRGQYLEIYVKECLSRSDIEPVGWPVDKGEKKAYTSIRYQVEGEMIDVDVHGISQPLAILLCEVKTSQKVVMNELRRVEDLFDRLIKALHRLSGREFRHLNLFIITGGFDQNIPVGAYKRKGWELIDRTSIPGLTEKLKSIKNEI